MSEVAIAPSASTEPETVQSLVSAFRGESIATESSSIVVEVSLLLIVLVLLASVGYLVWRQLREQRGKQPTSLFAGLCLAHTLASNDRKLLKQLAQSHGLNDPATLFLDPERFVAEFLPNEMHGRAAEIATLGQRLFA